MQQLHRTVTVMEDSDFTEVGDEGHEGPQARSKARLLWPTGGCGHVASKVVTSCWHFSEAAKP